MNRDISNRKIHTLTGNKSLIKSTKSYQHEQIINPWTYLPEMSSSQNERRIKLIHGEQMALIIPLTNFRENIGDILYTLSVCVI